MLAALLVPLSRARLCRFRLLVSSDTMLWWHRDLLKRRHARASVNRRRGRPRTLASIRRLVLRLAPENPIWGYRRIHGELALLGIAIAPSTVWEILKADGVEPAPQRTTVTWVDFLRSQAEAILAIDFIETIALTGAREYILTAVHHTGRRVRVLGTTAVAPVRSLIRDRDGKYPALIDEILADAGITTGLTGVRMPRMNSITERWVKTLCTELLDRMLI